MKDNADSILVRKAVEGETSAFGELIRRNQDYIYNSIFYMISDAEQAEDLTQTVFLKSFEKLQTFQGRAKFSTWLYAIMINTVRTFWREKERHGHTSIDQEYDTGSGPLSVEIEAQGLKPWEVLVSKENVESVRNAIAGLEKEHREIIVLRDIEGLSYDDLATALDIPQGTVKSRLARARSALKRRLESTMGER